MDAEVEWLEEIEPGSAIEVDLRLGPPGVEIGGRVVASRRFPALQREGLWRRMLPGEKIALWKAIPIYAVLSVVLPIVNRLPQDSLLVVIAPQESADG